MARCQESHQGKLQIVREQDHYFRANKKLWEAKTPIHFNSEFYRLNEFKQGATSLRHIEIEELGDLSGKKILHLQCHFGLDTLSFSRMGAEVTGIDISEKSIDTAKKLAEEMELPARFICCNLYDAGQQLNETFDLVFTSYGVINWLPELDRWAGIISNFLNPGGYFYMVEFHPLIWMLDEQYQNLHYHYFHKKEPYEIISSTNYADIKSEVNLKEYVWNHSLSDVINSLINNHLQIEFLNEFPYSTWNCFPGMEQIAPEKWVFKHFQDKIPYLFSVKAHPEAPPSNTHLGH